MAEAQCFKYAGRWAVRVAEVPHEARQASRRTFVSTAGATAGFMIVSRHVLVAGFEAPSDRLNIAVVGWRAGRQ